MSSGKPDDSALLAEAMTWFCRMRSPGDDLEDPYNDPVERQRAFGEWLRASRRHVWAYLEAVDHFRKLRAQAPPTSTEVNTVYSGARPRVTINSAAQRGLWLTAWHSTGRRLLTIGYSLQMTHVRHRVYAIVLAAAWVMMGAGPVLSPAPASCYQHYATALGQQRSIALADGTTIVLNTASTLYVCLAPNERIAQLVSGEALFNVHHDSMWPFHVLSGATSIEDVGTLFDVYRRVTGTRLAVLDGQVAIHREPTDQPNPDHASDALIVNAGEQVDIPFMRSGAVSVTTLDSEHRRQLTAWRDNKIVLKGLSLAEATDEISRYNPVKFVISDPAVAARKLGGQITATRVDKFLEAIQRQLDVVSTPIATKSGVRIIALTKKPGRQ